MSFCKSCLLVIDENPVAVLLRCDESEHRFKLLCKPCRQIIYNNNQNALKGLHNFSYVNPNLSVSRAETKNNTCKSLDFSTEKIESSWHVHSGEQNTRQTDKKQEIKPKAPKIVNKPNKRKNSLLVGKHHLTGQATLDKWLRH